MTETPPLCTSCGHHHEQGVKCALCGHVGKSQMFAKMRSKAEERRAVRAEICPFPMLSATPPLRDLFETALPGWELVQMGTQTQILFLFKGDLLVGCSAFDLLAAETSPSSVNICVHALHVAPDYQHMGFCWRILYEILQSLLQSSRCVLNVIFYLPSGSWMEAKFRQTGFQVVTSLPPFTYISNQQHVWLGYCLSSPDDVSKLRDYLVAQIAKSAH